jgi:hypothetical protein
MGTGRQVAEQTDKAETDYDRQKDRQTHNQTDRQACRNADTQTYR